MKKIIGIPGWKTGENSFGAGVNHLEFIAKFGIPRIIMPDDFSTDFDLLYLPGGMDLNPASYNEYPGFRVGNQDVHKQYFYDRKLQLFIDNKVPIIGICLGMQMLGVKFGAKLIQDLPFHPQSPDRWQEGHGIGVSEVGCMTIGLHRTKKSVKVNSHHHQGFVELSPELEALAIADDGVVEAFIHRKLPVIGIQWHPEEWHDSISIRAMEFLLAKSSKTSNVEVANVQA